MASQPEANPYELEWHDLMEAIRFDKPCNEGTRGVEASSDEHGTVCRSHRPGDYL